ncbi:MAG: RNA polymerase sigma factor [Clostridioides sp.]|nr:RNA polymerase sigma factor [Clostridioides sp.]
MNKEEMEQLITEATTGNSQALETILKSVQNLIFNLSLRMLGTVPDAEDATQDILVRIMTNLTSFRKESNFKTWVYRLATNYLIDYKKSMFAHYPLDFDYYSNDIKSGYIENSDDLLMGVNKDKLEKELKQSCTNVMLQCLDPPTRCIFILGTMFKIDSRIAGDILDMTPDNYRQKLSRARKKVAGFLSYHCGLTETGFCSCEKRIGYAIKHNRISPKKLRYVNLEEMNQDTLIDYTEIMESIDEISEVFSELPMYRSPVSAKKFIKRLLQSPRIEKIREFQMMEDSYD